MEQAPLARHVIRKSKLRVMSGGSSSLYDPDVIDITPPAAQKLKHNKVVPHDIIEIDEDEPSELLTFKETIDMSNKGKGKAIKDGYDNWKQIMDALANDIVYPATATDLGLMNEVPPYPTSNFGPQSQNPVNIDDFETDLTDYYDDDLVDYDDSLTLQAQFDAMDIPPGVEALIPWLDDHLEAKKKEATTKIVPGISSSSKKVEVEEDEVLKKYRLFKRFDTVENYSDHHYVNKGSTTEKLTSAWTKKIQEEWKILEAGLPDAIFVRVYEARMDLLRAVIVGAAGTPYHDGLFFFDVFFPSRYPSIPPEVYYHSGGLRLNPNLYNCGKVCLSLLNTWHGSKNERWDPKKSTALQVLVSIQALVLNAKPYFNEPGFASTAGQPYAEQMSLEYSENAFILSCRTMLYSLRNPPKHFEDFVKGHFRKNALYILVACKAYMHGAQVGCLVGGGIQDVDQGDKSCSMNFRKNVADIVKLLVPAFSRNGSKNCEQFLPSIDNSKEGHNKIPSLVGQSTALTLALPNAPNPTLSWGLHI